MEKNKASKQTPSNLFRAFKESIPTNSTILNHILMIAQSVTQVLNLTLISNIGLEPWILLALKCLGGLVFISIISILSLIREPLPIDYNTKVLSYCYSIGQILVMGIYFLCGSIDDRVNYNFMLLEPALVVFGIFYNKDLYLNKKNSLWKRIIYMFLIFWSVITSARSIINFVQLKKSWIFLICLILCTSIFVICKIVYYFTIIKINRNKTRPLEISAICVLNVSKVGIPIGVLVHTWRMNKLLPAREYKLFLLDLTRCDRLSALKVILSSFISFGIIFPLQIITIPNVSLLEYILYSIFPSILLSHNYIPVGFIFAAILLIINKSYERFKISEEGSIQFETVK
ncbi:uncharacterized protein ELE39_001737 [Cryptosporidium sp. chipmunk genotype I]|uniref:uncharacterized protein n=1 Tax=Cryptosporidium sp. chipmunk genotype I TaxID=1280935 RepID=UPI00351A246E|nr:hypothetical protein ELE39_001737 [Cryptosporidium sp. chipmunk genotype I]